MPSKISGKKDSEDNHSLELNNIDGDINSSCSSSNHSSDHEHTCHDCNSKTDYYKAILDMNGLSINVITSEESIILDLLDKIDDPEKKKQVIFKYLHGKQNPPTPNDSKQIPTIGNTFNFSTVMDRLQTIEPKGPTIQDLQGEILSLKRDVKTLSTRISLLELHNIEEVKSEEEEEEEIYLNDNNNRLKINPDIINDTKIPSPSKEQEILSIDRVVFQKWYVSIKIVISKDFTFEGIALIDSGADLNCIKEGLVPTKSVEFASKFPDEIREKTQLQRFLGSLNYIADFYQDLYKDTKVLYQRLQKNPQPWTIVHTQAIRRIKLRAKTLPCLCLPLPEAFKIVETDASDIGYGGILKQKVDGKMTPPRASSQKSGKGLLPRPNRYNLRKSIGSSSSQSNQEAMLGKFENSGYNAHAHCPDIIQIEDEEQDLSPIEVANNYLTNGWAYPQKASGKSRDYYEEILRSTKSAVLTHNFEKPPRHSSRNIELPFQFSKIEILKFITKKQWGIDPTRIRELPPHFSPRHFNYFDYIDAWNHVLLYQNPSHKHSWFIFFSRNFDGNFPNWIANWWLNYGPDFEEWPSTQVTEAYQLYAPMVKGLPKLQFMADFSIPWILCWQYAIQKSTNSSLEYPPSLVRQFGSKWRPKFDDSHCNIEAVTEIFPTLKAASTKWKSYPKTKSHALHCEAEFSKRKNEILCRLSKEKPFLNKRELLQVVTFEMLKMSEEDYNADSDNSANSTKESSSGKEGSDEPITDNMSTGPTIDNIYLSTNVTKSHTSPSKNIHELNIESIEKDLNNWSIPKVNPSSLYVKQFEFKQTYSIKSVEQTMDISKDNQSFQLFSKSALEKHKRKFRYVHIGLVQIGITSLTKEGLDTHVWAALRDDRHLSFDDSLLGMVETSLCNGPMYFNCYPNFSVSLSDPHIMDVLTLDIKTQRYNMRPQAQNLVLIYRMYSAFKQIADPGKSVILFQSNPDKTNVMLPRRIKFNELTPPEDWVIENKATHRQVNPHNTQIDHIIETPEGNVKIRFSQPETSSQNYKILHSGSSSQSARYSCSSIPSQNFQSCQNNEYHSIPPSRSSRDPKIIFQGIRNNNSSVPETMYTVETPSEMPSSSGQNQNNYNPSIHDFDYNVLVIEDFQIDHKKLNDEFYAKHNRTNRAWYRISFSTEQRAQYKELFFQTLKAYKTYFPFFGWFYSYCLDNNIEIPEYMNPQKQINVFKRITREWYIWPTHEKQESIHPPFNKFAMKGDMNSNFLAAPLKHIVDTSTSNHLNSVTAGEIQSLAEQSNYTNIILSTIGEQTTRIEDTIFQVKDVVSDFYSKMQPPKGISDNIFGTSPSFNLASSSSSAVRNIEQPLIKPSIDLDSRFKLNSEEPNGEFLKELMSKLGQIKTPKEKYPKVETSQSSPKHINMIGDIGSESEIEPDKLEKQFITAIGATNSRPPLRNYYTRTTPVDMQLEEKNFSIPSSFNGSSIYEWNLDGMTDYQVITLLQHMLMAANSAHNRNLGESEAVIARYLIAGFTGQLRGWWDFYLTPTDQNNILNSIKIEPNGNPILINEQPLSDAVTTLVTAITKHFIGNASTVLETGRELLLNLRCPTLTHFRCSCSSSNHSSDHEHTCHDCNSKTDYYKAILNMNGLSINVITSEESIILDLLDKIDDPEKKKQVIFKYLHGKQSPPTPNDSKQIPTIGNTFNFSTVMDRLQTIEPKGPTIQDLQGEILSLKRDVKTLSTRISLLELHNIEEVKSEEEEEEIYLNDNNNRLKINPDIINDTKIPSPSKEQEILSIDRVVFQKWYVSIKIVISKDFTFEGIALIDSGADLNCIKEGLVPTKYCETTRQALTTANNGRMKINYKISESWVCNDGICLKTHFIVVRGLSQSIILGTPFLSLLNPMTVDDKGIHSKALDHDICFKFINPPQEQIIHSLKKELIFRQNQICFLNEDLKFQKINRSVEFASKFPDEIKEKTQLQRFLGSLNYIADFYQDLYKDTKVLYQRLQKNPQPWTIVHTQAIRRIKLRAKTLPCLCLPLPEAFKIVETDASDIGYGGILKQKVDGKMTPPRASSQKSGKGLLPRPNRYNLRKSIGSSSSQPNQEAMLGKFENSGYNAHAHCPDIIQIEDEEQDLSPIEVANNYLTNGWAYPQKASGKSRDYYEEILRLTKSAVLTHNFEKPPRHSSRNIELPFQFSKIEILKFITKKQWGIDPTRIRELPPHFSPRHFNYFDYIDAWNHVLLYQNPSHKHSWFIFFSRNFDENFPNWIANWWLNYGPDFEEWPSTQVTEAYQLYAPMVKGLPKLQFMADFSIPWILCWQYAIQKSTNSSLEYPPTLVRQFGSKWWPKFDDSHCNIEAVTEIFPTLKAASTKWKSYPKTKSHALHCEAEFFKRKNEILCRLSKEKPFLNKRELLQVVTFEMLKMSEEDYNADSDNSANNTKESSSGKEGSDEPITDNMSTGPTIDNMIKRDVKTLSTRISLLELHNVEEVRNEEEEEEIYLNDNNNVLKINPDFANDTNIPSPSKEQEILSIDRVVFQKWYVSVKIVIYKDFTFEGIALIDSGVVLNCIKEGLVPTKYCETTRQALTFANNDCYQDLYKDTKVLYQRLQKNPQPCTIVHTQAIRRIKLRAKTLPCLCLPLPEAFKIIETDASDIGYGGILKQRIDGKMTPPRASFQKSGKGLLPRPNRYNLRKSIGSSSLQPSREAML
ncbi:hypothetical protein RJ640_001306 [Escallonia rubra]|uniref:Uncharacterized protein n=1 Tax=Escallonia rubra TaxID=112253 RepID=A0AA88U5G5_9ASTE|nr:hypothetical protein RJ640_001306 [Escallonia rubra]